MAAFDTFNFSCSVETIGDKKRRNFMEANWTDGPNGTRPVLRNIFIYCFCNVFSAHGLPPKFMALISLRMSSTRQAVQRSPSFTGFGYRPLETPAHHVDFDTGMIAGVGGFVCLSPMICRSLKNPVSGNA